MFSLLIFLTFSSQKTKVLIFDAGSSSTRVYGYQYENADDPLSYEAIKLEDGSTFYKSGTIRLADAAADPKKVDLILEELLTNYTENLLTDEEKPSIRLLVYGTAGMRYLSVENQTKVLDLIYEKIKTGFKYSVKREDFQVITGTFEGLYAWIALNRLRQAFGTEEKTLPIFEIGGASLQFAIQVDSKPNNLIGNYVNEVQIGKDNYKVFAHSWLGFGGDQALEAVHRQLYKEGIQETPCTLTDAQLNFTFDNQEVSFTGKADFDKCYQYLSDYLLIKSNSSDCQNFPCIFQDTTTKNCVPLPKEFEEIYAQGVPARSAEFLKINSTMYLDEYEQTSREFSNYTYQEAKDHDPDWAEYKYLHQAFFQQILTINFVKRGFNEFVKNLLINAPTKIGGTEPQWTLGAVMNACSTTVVIHYSHPWWFYAAIVVASLAVVIFIAIIVYVFVKKRKANKINQLQSISDNLLV